MSINNDRRDIIPIWKKSSSISKSEELSQIKPRPIPTASESQIQKALADFEASKNIGTAADLLHSARIENDVPNSRLAAKFILDCNENLSDLTAVCKKVLNIESDKSEVAVGTEIGLIRARLVKNSQNPLAWIDLARAYIILNEREKSEKAMWVALRYADQHRWISRMATTLFIHLGEVEKAQKALSRNKNLRSDPWLLSTELAVSRIATRPLKNWNLAKKIIDSGIAPVHLSELASSLATSEIIDGAEKKAKVLFKQSLICPTSNSLAQVKWAERSYMLGFSKQIQTSLEKSQSAFEAKYWEHYEKGEMWLALQCAQAWWDDEPYSASPPKAITYIASLLNDTELLLNTAERGLIANPDDTTLKLNFFYTKLSDIRYKSNLDQDSIIRISRVLRTIMHGDDKDEAAHAAANVGMLAYRLGESNIGKSYYDQAEQYYEKSRDSYQLFLLLNHYREALISEAEWAPEIKQRITEKVRHSPASVSSAARFYLHQIGILEKQENPWLIKLSKPFQKEPELVSTKRIEAVSFQDLTTKFWLPEDFLTANQSLDLLKKSPTQIINKVRLP